MKIIFIGTPKFGAIILEGLIKNNYKNHASLRSAEPCNAPHYRPVLVITASDKPAGRKQVLTSPPVKEAAQKNNIPVLQPSKIEDSKTEIEKLKPDLIISAAYGEIIPKEILEIPKYGCLNIHPSLLPKYRGPSPIQTAILNGDKETGITIILMDEKMDHGKIVSSIKHPVPSDITYEKLEKELTELAVKLLIEIIPKWVKSEIEAQAQDESKATYTKIIKKEDGKIDWSKSAEEIERQIRAFYPWPGAFFFWKGKRIKVLEAKISKENKIIIKKLQPEGKKPMSAEEFKRGHHDFNPLF